jgi:uncharacterized protein
MRSALRALHRDLGYLAVGLTLVYAISGLAVNHIADWDPNFTRSERVVELGGPVDAPRVLAALAIRETPREVYRAGPAQLEIAFDKRNLHVNTRTGRVVDERESPRFFLRAANFLHLNRGKKAWRWFADGYAAGLLLLSLTGIFMLPGKRGIRGRGALFVAAGVAMPLLYLAIAGR